MLSILILNPSFMKLILSTSFFCFSLLVLVLFGQELYDLSILKEAFIAIECHSELSGGNFWLYYAENFLLVFFALIYTISFVVFTFRKKPFDRRIMLFSAMAMVFLFLYGLLRFYFFYN
jgi:hypothetical protein